jgi:hypothetical protein
LWPPIRAVRQRANGRPQRSAIGIFAWNAAEKDSVGGIVVLVGPDGEMPHKPVDQYQHALEVLCGKFLVGAS